MTWQQLRVLTEKWEWRDPRTGGVVTGFNPPESAKERRRKPFHITYVTKSGQVESGVCITLKVFLRHHQRMIQFTASNEIRRICDILVMEVDGIRIVAG